MPADEKNTDVYGVGNALVDILAQVPDDFVREHALVKGSMMLVDPEKQGGLLKRLDVYPLKLRSGGSAANTMVTIAQSGGSGFYAGKVARDTNGEFYRQDLLDSGIHFDVCPAPLSGPPTGSCIVLTTPDAERTMCTNLGVSTALARSDMDADQIAQSKYIYVEGYLWDAEHPRAASVEAMERARQSNTKVAFTFSDHFLVNRYPDDFRWLVSEHCDLVFCNADEVRQFCGAESLQQCAAELGKIVEMACITDGANGCLVVQENEVVKVDGFSVDAVDTVGAGDAFAGGFLYGITNGLSLTQAARWGNYFASRVVQVYGARLEDKISDDLTKIVGGQ